MRRFLSTGFKPTRRFLSTGFKHDRRVLSATFTPVLRSGFKPALCSGFTPVLSTGFKRTTGILFARFSPGFTQLCGCTQALCAEFPHHTHVFIHLFYGAMVL
jgi:hypothetical protein